MGPFYDMKPSNGCTGGGMARIEQRIFVLLDRVRRRTPACALQYIGQRTPATLDPGDLPALAADTVIVPSIKTMRVRRQHAKAAMSNVIAIQVGRRWRNAHIGIGGIAVAFGRLG